MHVKKFIALMLACVTLTALPGCHIKAAEELYSPPKRSEAYRGLQIKIDEVMDGLDYSAPIAGENQQTVQLADLNGDGTNEYILFAKGTAEQPMQIFIFDQVNGEYSLLDSVSASGAAFEQVEYVQMDDKPGLEMVVGYQLSGEVMRIVSVYSLHGTQMEQLIRTHYAKFVCCDLDVDKKSELLVLRQKHSEPSRFRALYEQEIRDLLPNDVADDPVAVATLSALFKMPPQFWAIWREELYKAVEAQKKSSE